MQKYSLIFVVVAASLLWGPVGTAQNNPNNGPAADPVGDSIFACSKAIGQLEAGKDVSGKDLPQGDTLGHDTAIAFLKACNIGVESSGKKSGGGTVVEDFHCSRVSGCTKGGCACTSLTDVRKDTILGAMNLSIYVRLWHGDEEPHEGSNASCAAAKLVVNGGTELGHGAGTESHYNGYKLDFGQSKGDNLKCLWPYMYWSGDWVFDGFRIKGGGISVRDLSDGIITVRNEKNKKETEVKGFCLNGSALKYLPAQSGDAVAYDTLGRNDGVRMVNGDHVAVLEQGSPHWDILFRGREYTRRPPGPNDISPELKACAKIEAPESAAAKPSKAQ